MTPAGNPVETALRESEARYRSALVAGRMGSWETDLEAGTRTWSKEGMDLFGIDLPEGRGQVGGEHDEYEAALHPDDRHLARDFHALADRQDSFIAEYRIVRPDGRTLWLSGRGLVVARLADGRARRLISIMADVTERRQVEEVLRIERERLALALQAGQMGVYDLDVVNDSLWWSPQTYVVFGVSPETFTPTRESVTDLIHPDDRREFIQGRKDALDRRQPFIHEFRCLRADGRIAWISHRGHAEYDASGKPVRSFGVSLDVTERKLAEQTLQEADRMKDSFIATLAHELRNPLAPIRNAVQLLGRGEAADPQVVWCREVIDRQVTQMSRLLEDLLDVSRLTRGQFALRREPLAMPAVVEQALEIAQPRIEEYGHSLTIRLPETPVRVDGDLTRLAQVFSNLLINAAKYTHPGGRLVLAMQVLGDAVEVRVSDNGIGIAAEQLPHVFEMFAQGAAANDSSQGGLGIGLALAKGFVEMHGGSISAHSAGPGKGSEFVVRLPLAQAGAPDPAAAAATKRSAADSAASPARCRILVADDLHDSADSLALLLGAIGHDVRVAYDGEEALRVAGEFRPEIVLLDLGMPKLSGFEVCRRIRETSWGRTARLVAQSGWGQDEDRRRTAEAGFDHHLVKPIDPEALEDLLRTLASADAPTR
ncbi:MAG: PAS domain-containing protein [Burkholderiales bacterium]|nr:PAS domain-containing protein [Burkholderiales bacterium]